MNKEYKYVSAVIYMHNEQKNIKTFLSIVHRYLNEHFTKYEIICVDDASSDNCVKKVKEVVEEENLENVTLISMSIFQGRELGMEAGVDLSIGDYVYELEWIDMFDTNTYEDKLWEAYCKAIEGFDVVTYSSKENKGIGSVMFYSIYNKSNRSYTELTPERFRIVTRRAINRVSRMNKSIVYRKALYANSGLRTCVIGDRPLNESYYKKNVIQNKSKTGLSVLLAYTGFVPKVVVVAEVFFLILLIFSLISFLSPVVEWHVSLLLCVISGVSCVLGMIGVLEVKYNELILEIILKKENYIVSSVEKLVNSEEK